MAQATLSNKQAALTDTPFDVLIVGGGTGGIDVAARLARELKGARIAIIEPSSVHYYQPLWTLVGGGVFDKQLSARPESSLIPRGVDWLEDAVEEVDAEANRLRTAEGRWVSYRFLVLAPGIQVNWSAVKGLPQALGKDGVASNYSYDSVDKTWQYIRGFRSGTALFTQPSTPIKCGGAPQKIAYLADDHFRKAGVRDGAQVIFASGGAGLFAVPKYAEPLRAVAARKQIDLRFRQELREIRADIHEAVFENLDTGEKSTVRYDILHATPPMSPPDFVVRSGLGNEGGWVDVDKHTLQHVRHANIFSLGDASSLPTSKTGAAIRKQAPVLVKNLVHAFRGRPGGSLYDGYTSCPLVTGYGRLILAEFDYDLTPRETFPFDQAKERRSMYLLKAYGLPVLYWQGMMKGRA